MRKKTFIMIMCNKIPTPTNTPTDLKNNRNISK